MKKSRGTMIILGLALVVGSAAARVDDSHKSSLTQKTMALVNAKDSGGKRVAALDICSLLVNERKHDVPAQLVVALSDALEVDDQGVRYFSIRSLALIGPRASSALPALKRLLDAERHPPLGTILLGVSPIPRIENAIDVIEGRVVSIRPALSEQCDDPVPGV